MPNKYFNYNYQHVTDHSPERKQFKEIFTQALKNNSKYITQLDRYFINDYKLIESIKFYAG